MFTIILRKLVLGDNAYIHRKYNYDGRITLTRDEDESIKFSTYDEALMVINADKFLAGIDVIAVLV